jgi:uncharacterized protein
VENDHGTFFRRRLVLGIDERYGDCRIGDFLWLNAESAAVLARNPGLAATSLERMLFLDTETTGLAGGTGTYAFLVGLGYFQQDAHGGAWHFVLEQCMMRSYAEERAMLRGIAERLEGFDGLVTFNGRAFDAPLLETRFLMSRMRVSLEDWLHFDLLAPARRLWRLAAGSCALQNLERHILRIGRNEDIESFLIPAIFHQYLRDGDGRYLQRVFNHNRADILSMVALAIRACTMLEAPATGDRVAGSGPGPAISAAEYVGLGRVYEQMGNVVAAERAYRWALDGSLPNELRYRTLHHLASLLKRIGRHDEAVTYWQEIAGGAPVHSVAALIELSKYFEHRRRDASRAYDLVLLAKSRWLAARAPAERTLPGIGNWSLKVAPAAPDDFERRLARLERKSREVRG